MKHAAYCGTRAIYSDMEAAAKSLVANSDVGRIWFVIEDDEFPSELPDIVRCVNVANQTIFDPQGPNMDSQYTYMAMMRIALCHVLPKVDTVLSLDCDTYAVRDCSDLWDVPLDGYYLAAAHEWHRTGNGLLYCNFGVVYYNLEAMRDGKADECIEVLNRRKYTWVEQDVGNYLCQGRIYDLPSIYNSNYWTDKGSDAGHVIKHYAGVPRSEWADSPLSRKYRAMTWDEALETRRRR